MNSEAAIEKNAACASPATARASSVLPVPGRSEQQHAVRHPPAEPLVALRGLEEVDDLGQLGLGLVDPGDVVERDPDLLGIDAARLRAPEVARARPCRRRRPRRAARAARTGRRAAASGRTRAGSRPAATCSGVGDFALTCDALAPAAACVSCRVVPERRHLRSRTASSASRLDRSAGSSTLVVNVPWIVSPLRRDRLDLPGLDLLEEVRAERDRHPRLARAGWNEQHGEPVERQQHEHEDPEARAAGAAAGAGARGIPRPSGAGATRQPRLSRGIGAGMPSILPGREPARRFGTLTVWQPNYPAPGRVVARLARQVELARRNGRFDAFAIPRARHPRRRPGGGVGARRQAGGQPPERDRRRRRPRRAGPRPARSRRDRPPPDRRSG